MFTLVLPHRRLTGEPANVQPDRRAGYREAEGGCGPRPLASSWALRDLVFRQQERSGPCLCRTQLRSHVRGGSCGSDRRAPSRIERTGSVILVSSCLPLVRDEDARRCRRGDPAAPTVPSTQCLSRLGSGQGGGRPRLRARPADEGRAVARDDHEPAPWMAKLRDLIGLADPPARSLSRFELPAEASLARPEHLDLPNVHPTAPGTGDTDAPRPTAASAPPRTTPASSRRNTTAVDERAKSPVGHRGTRPENAGTKAPGIADPDVARVVPPPAIATRTVLTYLPHGLQRPPYGR